MTKLAKQTFQDRSVIVITRRINPFVAQAMIHLKTDGHVPTSVQKNLIAWDNGTLPSQK